ncbi:NAD(P)-dependent oxidoreductase [Desulfovibrio inopinatus]|uniref:NAD(P)-dependent oxidoreductase n=1 Tax=Desulfovibrio inopinatus TaxID=102109 RepID=UPI0003FC9156|nr:NAD(P)-dependent oxidoreductase [Desulfovibrio inopinatus]
MSEKLKIGWIGLGKMGVPMSKNLLKAGYEVLVYNRTKSKAKEVVDEGATFVDTLAELGAQCDVVVSMISDDTALKLISINDGGVLHTMKPGTVYIDMSTVSPTASAEVDGMAKEKQVSYLRAPVSGSTVLAQAGNLTIFASGPQDAYDRVLPLFEVMGAKQFHVGTGEEARFLKLTLNMMVGITSAMVGEALAFGEAGGMDWEQMLDIVANSVVASPLVGYKVNALKERNFAPAFTASQMAKDFDIALDAAKQTNAPMPITAMVRQFWGIMKAQDMGELDFFAYVSLLEKMSGMSK